MRIVVGKDKLIKLVLFLSAGILFLAAWIRGAVTYREFHDVKWFFLVAMSYSLIVFLHLSYRAILSLFYTQIVPKPGFHPSLSLIIPAYNEGKMILTCVISALEADYAGEKEIICVNDGSTDDTLQYLEELKARYPGTFTLLTFEKNRGKREAIASGARISTGQLIVLVDSDTCVEKNALSHLVAPFQDAKVGATTGAVRVLNENENLLTKIMSVRYIIAFDFYRVSHSVIKTVMVCSGVLSAYRRDIFMRVMPEWLNQHFLGKKCTYGDDRSLTNFILKSGYDTLYVQNAYAYTMAPSTLKKLMKMISRWNKSYIRENIIFLSFIFKKFEKRYKPVAIFDFFLTNFILVFQYVAMGCSLVFCLSHPIYILKFLVTITLISMFYMGCYIKMRKNMDFVYGFLYSYMFIFLLCWTLPYAFFTMKDDSWLTR